MVTGCQPWKLNTVKFKYFLVWNIRDLQYVGQNADYVSYWDRSSLVQVQISLLLVQYAMSEITTDVNHTHNMRDGRGKKRHLLHLHKLLFDIPLPTFGAVHNMADPGQDLIMPEVRRHPYRDPISSTLGWLQTRIGIRADRATGADY